VQPAAFKPLVSVVSLVSDLSMHLTRPSRIHALQDMNTDFTDSEGRRCIEFSLTKLTKLIDTCSQQAMVDGSA